MLKLLGLDICSETVVGNDMLRGISGGQKKRVTTGISFHNPFRPFNHPISSLCSFSLVLAKSEIFFVHFEHENAMFHRCLLELRK